MYSLPALFIIALLRPLRALDLNSLSALFIAALLRPLRALDLYMSYCRPFPHSADPSYVQHLYPLFVFSPFSALCGPLICIASASALVIVALLLILRALDLYSLLYNVFVARFLPLRTFDLYCLYPLTLFSPFSSSAGP